MIIRITVLFILLAASGNIYAQDQREHQGGRNEAKTQSQQEDTTGKKETPWPIPFNPSREIGADSQVSFPTDI